jgi:hypothetical protein
MHPSPLLFHGLTSISIDVYLAQTRVPFLYCCHNHRNTEIQQLAQTWAQPGLVSVPKHRSQVTCASSTRLQHLPTNARCLPSTRNSGQDRPLAAQITPLRLAPLSAFEYLADTTNLNPTNPLAISPADANYGYLNPRTPPSHRSRLAKISLTKLNGNREATFNLENAPSHSRLPRHDGGYSATEGDLELHAREDKCGAHNRGHWRHGPGRCASRLWRAP